MNGMIPTTMQRFALTALRRTPRGSVTAAVRGYRGDSGDAHPNLSATEEELLRKGKPIYDAIRERHVRPVQLKDLSLENIKDLESNAADSSEDLELEIRRKRLIYRAKQRGWLEVDVLLGTWASEFVPKLTGDELDQFEDFVNMETIDIYNVITLRLDVPEEMKRENGEGVVEKIQEWARSSPLGKADPAAYKKAKETGNLI